MLAQDTYSTTHQQPFFDSDQHVNYLGTERITSSPYSTQSSLHSQYSNFQTTPLSTIFDIVTSAAPRRTNNFRLTASTPNYFELGNSQILSQVPDLMPSDSQWLRTGHQTPGVTHRFGHQRESSLSSLGSNGPASPYNPNTSNPHIAVTDSSSDVFHDLNGGDSNYSYQPTKSILGDNFYNMQNLNGHGTDTNNMSYADDLSDLKGQQQQCQRPKTDRGPLPAPDLMGSSTRSHPVSVASSVVGGDSPATPSFQELEDDGRRRKNVCNVPKLDRTMTDIYSDELYNPNFTITSASPPPQAHLAMSPSNDVFNQRIEAANRQHLNAVHSPLSTSSRNQSPFRNDSPLAPSSNEFSQESNPVQYNTAQQLREKRKANQDAKALAQQLVGKANKQQQGTPKTISPKDAMLEFNEPTDESNFPLFPPQETNNFDLAQLSRSMSEQTQNFHAPATLSSQFNFNMPNNLQLPQTYPFVARTQRQQQATTSVSTFSRVGSVETNASNSSDGSMSRPTRTSADGGTFTCTYYGCAERFQTPALLQKHKREGHRQANILNNVRQSIPSPGIPASLVNTQAGPHRCDRINPSTGKSCNTVFSRPYDLTRHEDTIHNARKQKVQCPICTEEKTFSRADALTRHFRVVHPDVEFSGKHRRRGGSPP